MNEVRVCENCKHHNPIDNLECEKCGFDLSFCIPVSEDNLIQKKCLRSLSDGEEIVLKEETLIGRDGVNADYFEKSKYISRRHATIYIENDNVFIIDASTNGTFINGKRMEKMIKQPLHIGDKITFADLEFILEGK